MSRPGTRAVIRRALLSAALVLLLAGERTAPSLRDIIGPGAPVRADRLSLSRQDPALDRVGRLRFLEGWRLTSTDPVFGGFSAMAVDGRRFTLVSDGGSVVRFALSPDGRASEVRFHDLAQGPCDGRLKEGRDVEALARDPATGDWWLAFERSNSIARYSPDLVHMRAFAAPPAMANWPDNAGAEAMARLHDGRLLVMAEGGRNADGSRRALIFSGDPVSAGAKVMHIGFRPPDGFRVTDAATLPDGRVIALHRRVNARGLRIERDGGLLLVGGIDTSVAIYDPRGVSDGAVMTAEPVARLAWPLNVDNFEGVAVAREDGRTILWIVSDDNRRSFERTILMKFVLEDRPGGERPARRIRRPRPASSRSRASASGRAG